MIEKVNILAPLLDHAVSSKEQRWPTYDGQMLDRRDYVSSSEVGKCARQIWFGKNLPPIEGKFRWGFAQRGHGHEAWVVEQLRALDSEFDFLHIGDEQVSFYDGNQSGTPDGVFGVDNEWWLFEHKSIDPRSKVALLPKPEHIKQVVQNMDIVEACLDIDFAGGLLVYSNASDYSLTYEFWIDRHSPQVGEMMTTLEERAAMIINATRAEDVEPEGLFTGGCKLCAFGSQCSASVAASKQEKNRNADIIRKSSDIFG
jgi:hypothetical protein